MKNLLQIVDIIEIRTNGIQIEIQDPYGTVEILFAGEALRKVFTALTLLYSLVETEESAKVFLVEEPEAHLYPTLQSGVFTLFCDIANANDIQLFVTTNAESILNLCSVVKLSCIHTHILL